MWIFPKTIYSLYSASNLKHCAESSRFSGTECHICCTFPLTFNYPPALPSRRQGEARARPAEVRAAAVAPLPTEFAATASALPGVVGVALRAATVVLAIVTGEEREVGVAADVSAGPALALQTGGVGGVVVVGADVSPLFQAVQRGVHLLDACLAFDAGRVVVHFDDHAIVAEPEFDAVRVHLASPQASAA